MQFCAKVTMLFLQGYMSISFKSILYSLSKREYRVTAYWSLNHLKWKTKSVLKSQLKNSAYISCIVIQSSGNIFQFLNIWKKSMYRGRICFILWDKVEFQQKKKKKRYHRNSIAGLNTSFFMALCKTGLQCTTWVWIRKNFFWYELFPDANITVLKQS